MCSIICYTEADPSLRYHLKMEIPYGGRLSSKPQRLNDDCCVGYTDVDVTIYELLNVVVGSTGLCMGISLSASLIHSSNNRITVANSIGYV